ncbi:hypothetical protein HK097_008768 [Rhizophlyctis rosea]|uniref:Uncharacterized protein n=1 Tax=Rhizophlyctis rosea TaxID=64517 RepID=A0AAD5X4C4_9FUNG|nr:hypothetical protein HK097_008768 [Rhizophlyctis rosea]
MLTVLGDEDIAFTFIGNYSYATLLPEPSLGACTRDAGNPYLLPGAGPDGYPLLGPGYGLPAPGSVGYFYSNHDDDCKAAHMEIAVTVFDTLPTATASVSPSPSAIIITPTPTGSCEIETVTGPGTTITVTNSDTVTVTVTAPITTTPTTSTPCRCPSITLTATSCRGGGLVYPRCATGTPGSQAGFCSITSPACPTTTPMGDACPSARKYAQCGEFTPEVTFTSPPHYIMRVPSVFLLAATLLSLTTICGGQTNQGIPATAPPIVDEQKLMLAPMMDALDPNPTDAPDCMNDWCGGTGQFIDTIMKRCNSTLGKFNPNNPPTMDAVKKALGSCICGATDDQDGLDTLSSTWSTCVRCLNGGYGIRDEKFSSRLNDTAFTNACACEQPGQLDAILNMSNSSFSCTKRNNDMLGGRRRRTAVPPTVPSNNNTTTNNSTTPAAPANATGPVASVRPGASAAPVAAMSPTAAARAAQASPTAAPSFFGAQPIGNV